MQADDALGTGGGRGDRVGIEIAGVGGEDGVVADDAVEAPEQAGLDLEIVEHGFDDEIGGGELAGVVGHLEPGDAVVAHGGCEPARLDRLVEDAGDALAALVGGVGRLLDADDPVAGREHRDRDAGAHQAGADDADRFDAARGHALQLLDLAGLPLGEEDVAQCRRLGGIAQAQEGGALVGEAVFQIGLGRGLDEADGLGGGGLAARLGQDLLGDGFDGGRIGSGHVQHAGAAQRLLGKFADKGDRVFDRLLRNAVGEPERHCLGRLDRAAAADQVDGRSGCRSGAAGAACRPSRARCRA